MPEEEGKGEERRERKERKEKKIDKKFKNK
jgi:hypothetical protein